MSDLNSPDETKSVSGSESNPNGQVQKPNTPARSEAAVTQGTGPGKVGDHDFSTIGWNGAEPMGLDGLSPMSKDSHERMLSEMATGANDGAACMDPQGIGKTKDTYDAGLDWNGATGIMNASGAEHAQLRDPQSTKDSHELFSEDAQLRDPESKHDSAEHELFSSMGSRKLRDPNSRHDSDNDEDFDDLEGEHEGERE